MTTIAKTMVLPKLFELSKSEGKAFLHWTFVWVFLANSCFMALWIIGAPPRYGEIMVIALIGLITNKTSFFVRYAYFVAIMLWTTLNFIADIFNLDLPRLLASLKFIFSINLASSPVYVVATFSILGILVVAWFGMRRQSDIARWWLYPVAISLATGVAFVDYTIASDMRGHYKRAPAAGTVFSSAMKQTGMSERADGKRHLILIMVESLGLPVNNAEMDRLLFWHYRKSDAIAARYELSTGTSPFYGSTTRGEIREMCGRWAEYYPLMDARDENCLPNALARKGYETVSMHSFNGVFFDRAKWYPNIGFNEIEFADELIAKGAGECGGVFPGACDRDIPRLMAERLKDTDEPTFLYWLTVNSHLPVLEGNNLNVENCGNISPKLAKDYPLICRQFAVWDNTDKAIISEITASDFPDADILLVGDHMPPFFDRHHRKQIDPARVPWLYLKRK